MKKFAMMLAAGVVALGASAQAASVASADTYAVITIPVVEGDNLIGVSVLPLSGEVSPFLTDVLDIAAGATVKGLNEAGNGYGDDQYANAALAPVGKVYWYTANADATLYEIGKSPAAATEVSLTLMDMTVVTVPSPWTFADVEGTFTPGTRPSKADKIHVWNPDAQGYDAYWYKSTGWVKWDGTSAEDVEIGPGQGFFFEVKTATTAKINP